MGVWGRFVVKEPMILGHESSGIVSAVGEGVTTLQVGKMSVERGHVVDEYMG